MMYSEYNGVIRSAAMRKKKNGMASTYERLIHEDAEFEKDLEKRYRKFVLSEDQLAARQKDIRQPASRLKKLACHQR